MTETKKNKIRLAVLDYQQAKREYDRLDAEYDGSLWAESELNQQWNYMQKLRLKIEKLMEEK